MNKPAKISLWTIGSLMAVVIFLFVLMVLAARVINHESIKKKFRLRYHKHSTSRWIFNTLTYPSSRNQN